jgi:hypothetical protein
MKTTIAGKAKTVDFMCPEFEDCQKQLDLRILNPISFEFPLTRRSTMCIFLPETCEKQSAMARFLLATFARARYNN